EPDGRVEVALVGDADDEFVPDPGEVARVVGDVAAQDLGVGEGDEGAGGLGALDGLAGPAGLPDGGGEEVDADDVAEDVADGDAVADAVVLAEGVEDPGGEALDGGL